MSGFWGLAERWADWILKQFVEPVCDELASIRHAVESVRAELERGRGAQPVSVLMVGKSSFGEDSERLWTASMTALLMPGERRELEFCPQRLVLPGASIVCLGGSIVAARIGVEVQTMCSGYDGPVVVTRNACEIGQTIGINVRRLDDTAGL